MERYIIESLPSDHQHYFLAILVAYNELKQGHDLGFYEYETFDDYQPLLNNEKNYDYKRKKFVENFEIYKQFLPKDVTLQNIPKKPKDIKIELETKLSGITTKDNIKQVIQALFGPGGEKRTETNSTVRLPQKTFQEKFEISLRSQLRQTHRRK